MEKNTGERTAERYTVKIFVRPTMIWISHLWDEKYICVSNMNPNVLAVDQQEQLIHIDIKDTTSIFKVFIPNCYKEIYQWYTYTRCVPIVVEITYFALVPNRCIMSPCNISNQQQAIQNTVKL